MHCMDIPFALNNVDVAGPVLGTAPDLQILEARMSAAWAAFARTGNPSHPGIPEWLPFTPTGRETMVLDVEPQLVKDHKGAELKAINEIMDSLQT